MREIAPPPETRERWAVVIAAGLTVALFLGLAGYLVHVQRQVAAIMDRVHHIEELAGTIRYLDEVLTMSARLGAATGGSEWEDRYRKNGAPLDEAIKEATTLLPEAAGRDFAERTDAANQRLVAMELRAFELVRQRQREQALGLLMSAEYEAQKKVYAAGIDTLLAALHQQSDDLQADHAHSTRYGVGAAVAGAFVTGVGWLWVVHTLIKYRAARRQAQSVLSEREASFRSLAVELAASERKLRTIIESEPECVMVIAPDGRLLQMNAAGLAMIECDTLGQAQEQPLIEIVVPEHRAVFADVHQRALKGEKVQVEFEMIGRRGVRRQVESHAVPLHGETGAVAAVLAITRDVTQRKQAERDSRKEKEFSQMLIEAMPGVVYCFDETGKFLRWNKNLEQVSGYTAAQVAKMSPLEFFDPDDKQGIQERIKQVFTEGKADIEESVLTRDGRRIPYFFNGLRIALEDRLFVVGVGIDITTRKSAEAAIATLNAHLRQRADDLELALAESEEFAYAAAHNLRSPLRGIDGFAQAIVEDCGARLCTAGLEHIGRIRRSAQQMASLVDDLLALSRITRADLQPQAVDLSVMARSLIHEFQTKEPERLVEFTAPEHLPVQGDERLIRVMLEHLLANAWKFTAAHARAHIELGSLEMPAGERANFIRDDGVGFDLTYAAKLFLPFERLHGEAEFPGNGIGLAIVKRIIQRHGGRVWAEAGVGQGATFYFTLGEQREELS